MANVFLEDDREDLIERGFNNEQIEYLESLGMDPEQLFFDICHIMDDFGDTPDQIINSYMEANEEDENEDFPPPGASAPAAGGGKRKRKSRKSRKTKKSRKTIKRIKSRKSRKSRKRSIKK